MAASDTAVLHASPHLTHRPLVKPPSDSPCSLAHVVYLLPFLLSLLTLHLLTFLLLVRIKCYFFPILRFPFQGPLTLPLILFPLSLSRKCPSLTPPMVTPHFPLLLLPCLFRALKCPSPFPSLATLNSSASSLVFLSFLLLTPSLITQFLPYTSHTPPSLPRLVPSYSPS